MAVEFKDYYKILGVDRNADNKTIKSAYRRLARRHHPDVAKSKDGAERFKELSEAYEVLSDQGKRRRYDTLGPDWQRHAQGAGSEPGGGFRVAYGGDVGGLSDFFRTVFGERGAVWQGAGHVNGRSCPMCDGRGCQRSRRQVGVRTPGGVRSGQRVRVV